MCGIAGVYHYAAPARDVDSRVVTAMTRCLAHRGPDGEGLHVDGPVGLGNRRLAIVDPTPTGAQPMQSHGGRSWISYNGEIYNHAGFRVSLEARGHQFRGTSDTETLLLGLETWGPQFLAELAGIFGLAFWDAATRRLILARDPLGVKQVYYHDDGHRIAFASEIKALLHCPGVAAEVDPEAVNQYLHFHTPLFERTFFKGVKQVRAGESIEVTSHGLRHRFFWTPGGFAPRREAPEIQVAALREELSHVVERQLMSDVPVGCFFSGGIDSTAVAAFALRRDRTIRGFGLHFTGQGVIDERPYQEAAAKALGLELELTTLDGSSFPDDLLRLTYFQDSPVIGPAMLPMYHVSRLAASKVKVCLGGQAADELFGGYARYALAQPADTLARWLQRDGAADHVGAVGHAAVGGNLSRQLFDRRNLRRLGRTMLSSTDWRGRYFNNFARVVAGTWGDVFTSPGFHDRRAAHAIFDDVLDRSPATTPADKLLHWDVQTYLPGLFHQDDRMSMANSLESRVPLADPRLAQFAFETPFDLKMRGGASKWILRRAVDDLVPTMVLNRRKVGFDTPISRWMSELHPGFMRELLLSSRAQSRGFWEPRAIARILDKPYLEDWTDVVWKLASIEAWAKTFLDGETPNGVARFPRAT